MAYDAEFIRRNAPGPENLRRPRARFYETVAETNDFDVVRLIYEIRETPDGFRAFYDGAPV